MAGAGVMSIALPLLLVLAWPARVTAAGPKRAPNAQFQLHAGNASAESSFAGFYRLFNRSYPMGSAEFLERQRIYEENVAWVDSHNRRADRTWTAAINKLSDRLHSELQGLRGYRMHARSDRSRKPGASVQTSQPMPASLGFMSRSVLRNASSTPAEFTWVKKLKVTDVIMDQKACGSCWAFATAATLRAHSELYQTDRTFSTQQIVSCVENPRKCGGDGGCEGATAELALDYVKRAGCGTDDEFSYSAEDVKCPSTLHADGQGGPWLDTTQTSLVSGVNANDNQAGGRSFGMTDWRQLPANQLAPFKQALVEQGPIAASVATYAKWNVYSHGILDTCADEGNERQEFIVNHAVMVVGYGEDATIGKTPMKFWQIQNSWGRDWGENGFIRVKREDDSVEGKKCDWNEDPLVGTGCEGGPEKVYVCGSCGILYDNVVPTFSLSDKGLWNALQKRV